MIVRYMCAFTAHCRVNSLNTIWTTIQLRWHQSVIYHWNRLCSQSPIKSHICIWSCHSEAVFSSSLFIISKRSTNIHPNAKHDECVKNDKQAEKTSLNPPKKASVWPIFSNVIICTNHQFEEGIDKKRQKQSTEKATFANIHWITKSYAKKKEKNNALFEHIVQKMRHITNLTKTSKNIPKKKKRHHPKRKAHIELNCVCYDYPQCDTIKKYARQNDE